MGRQLGIGVTQSSGARGPSSQEVSPKSRARTRGKPNQRDSHIGMPILWNASCTSAVPQ